MGAIEPDLWSPDCECLEKKYVGQETDGEFKGYYASVCMDCGKKWFAENQEDAER